MDKEQMVVSLFESMAKTIAEQHTQKIAAATILKGERPSFDILKEMVQAFEKALTQAAVKLIDEYRKTNNSNVPYITRECHKIINDTIERFIKTL